MVAIALEVVELLPRCSDSRSTILLAVSVLECRGSKLWVDSSNLIIEDDENEEDNWAAGGGFWPPWSFGPVVMMDGR